ncbi:MAG: aminoglycoside phosphotransferase family protein [Duodenibacillus sp.]
MTQTSDARLEALTHWLGALAPQYGLDLSTTASASADASFRRYFRVQGDKASYIVMDAPAPQEDIRPFLKVCALMRDAGLNVPEIYASDPEQGFILMSDLGRETYLDALNEDNAARLMNAATDSLVLWQKASREGVLPVYDHAVLSREIHLFPEWYVGRHSGYTMTEQQSRIIEATFEKILANNLAQPRVFVHRDFMPRNLMVPLDDKGRPGVLDFQDALYGPVAYDIASLMRDAFLSWGESFVLDITIRYWEKARRAGIPVPADFGLFWRDVEWMGIQRHLKVLGIFARIHYRDGKPKYLADTPRFVHYVRETANRYDELKPINWLLDQFEDSKVVEQFTF